MVIVGGGMVGAAVGCGIGMDPVAVVCGWFLSSLD